VFLNSYFAAVINNKRYSFLLFVYFNAMMSEGLKRLLRKSWCLGIVCLCFPFGAISQELLLRHFTAGNGMISNVVYQVMEDSQGFLWFCTDQGICQFDGHEFKKYTSRDGLTDNTVFNIKEDEQKRLWLSCYNGKTCYLLNGKVHNAQNDMLCRLIERKSRSEGYSVLVSTNSLFLAYNFIHEISNELAVKASYFFDVNEVHSLFKLGRQTFFVSHYKIMTINNDKIYTTNCHEKIGEILVYKDTLYCTAFGNHDNNIIYKYCRSNDGGYLHLVNATSIEHRVNSLVSFNDSLILLATDDGVKVYPDGAPFILKGMQVGSIQKDVEGNYWFSTLTKGVYMLPSSFPKISGTDRDGLKGDVQSLFLTSDNVLFAGYDDGIFKAIDKNHVSSWSLPMSNSFNKIKKITALDKHNYVISSEKGLYTFDKGNNRIKKVTYIHAIKSACVKHDTCYMASAAGAYIIDLKQNRSSEIWNIRTTAINVDNSTVWMGTLNGIYVYKNGLVEKYNRDSLLSKSRIIDIEKIGTSTFVITTHQQGIFIINKDRIVHINDTNGLCSNICNKIFVDNSCNIWLCTNTGLDKIIFDTVKNTYTVVHQTCTKDISINDINDFVVRDNDLCIATSDGIVTIGKKNSIDPFIRTYITSLKAKGHVYEQKDSLLFNYNENDLQISFTGLAFTNEKNIQYKYVLHHQKTDTNYTNNNSVDLTELKPGSYTFTVWAKKSTSKNWLSKPAVIHFTIKHPYWEQPWFLVGAFCITVVSTIYIFRARLRKIKMAEAEKTIISQKIAALEMQALRAQINPHFIFNVLNSIHNYYSNNDERTANKYLTTFATLIRKILNNSREHWISLTEEIETIRLYVELEKMRANKLFDYTIIFDESYNSIVIPAMVIQPYVENAINHGLTNTGKIGNLLIAFKLDKETLVCEVNDDGIGINASKNTNLGSEYKKSLGMAITQERIDVINKIYNIDIKVTVTDKSEIDRSKSGTIVKIFIPLKTNQNG